MANKELLSSSTSSMSQVIILIKTCPKIHRHTHTQKEKINKSLYTVIVKIRQNKEKME